MFLSYCTNLLRARRQYSASARLLDVKSVKKAHPADLPQHHNSKFRDFLRHVRLLLPGTLLCHVLPWNSRVEQRKIAVYKSRRMAALNSLLHIVPLAGAITILALHWSKYWVGQTSDDATTLQFVAKFHELVMQASLVDILLYIIRTWALNGYLPLGALAGAARAPQLSYLWSLDFIAALGAPNKDFSSWRKLVFASFTLALLFLTAVVGPSSAILMIPRPGMPQLVATTTRYMNVSEDDLFPNHINQTHTLNL